MGPEKFFMEAQQRSLQKSASLQTIRERSNLGLCHKESLAVLSVDVRKSSALAERQTDETMFKVFQCFLPLMAYITNECDGEVISLRGDGLISAFGFGKPLSKEGETIETAYEAGMLMIQATQQVLNPFFVTKKVPVALEVGAAVDIGQVVITKIGLKDAVEVTAYGPAVNNAAKNNRRVNEISVSNAAWNSWKRPLPRSKEPWHHVAPENARII
jgi:class 3 adenylate cyclase